MSELNRLSAIERDHFAEIVESSLRVTERRHYFSWMQGILQTLIPHEIVICGADEGGSENLKLMYMSGSRYFRDEHFAASCQQPQGVVSRLVAEWQASGLPCVVAREVAMNGHAEMVEQLEAAELRNIALHGVRGPARRTLGIYAFSRIPADCVSNRMGYVLEVAVPHIHATFVRVLMNEARASGGTARVAGRQITPREAEILRWIKEGKTNSDIASILALSPWTVKNHVQTILKKLQAQTRSHAVARAMSMGILDSTSSS
jgi:transcriptional regulator EpsA